MIRLHLIRHGETDWNAEGRIQGQLESALSEAGEQQARALQGKLRHFDFDRVFCSSSTRARQTAGLALSHLEQSFTYLDALKEIFLGRWEGQLYKDIEVREPEASHAFRQEPHTFDVTGAETFSDLQNRATSAIADIVAMCRGQEVVIISHGAWIKSVLCHYEGRPLSQFWEPPRMHNCCHSIIEITSQGGAGKIVRYADLDEGF
ncbi:MAG: histidine phosphatase family protein [Gammaproteobacteria bacterium]|nr:MAG: histidine phosphatase family protein [Gammaproteobacteria bacterium]RLA56138.1 MAG: histidine phosphatase family protein [Gammaproteobacteria bacterium]HDY83203.1 histidine phosphatase family protein [Halieaceae bacterium]